VEGEQQSVRYAQQVINPIKHAQVVIPAPLAPSPLMDPLVNSVSMAPFPVLREQPIAPPVSVVTKPLLIALPV